MPSRSKISVISHTDVGRRVRELRLERGITQTELATLLGTAQAAISEVERGIRGFSVHQIVKLGRVLRTTPNEILGEERIPKRQRQPNPEIMRRVRRIERLPSAKQRAVLKVLDGFLQAHTAA